MIESREGIESEALRHDCFLCRPSAGLVVDVGVGGYTLAGLGPLAPGYAIVATHGHLAGLAAASRELLRQYADYTVGVVAKIAAHFGSCFVVEHGNMAVCGVSDEGRVHCFHPHFLLVPDPRCSVDPFAQLNWHDRRECDTLFEALDYGSRQGQYILAGPSGGPYSIYLSKGELPRQFARALLAEQLGKPELSSWRTVPDVAQTVQNAVALRALLHSR
jgi:hypothetical protein